MEGGVRPDSAARFIRKKTEAKAAAAAEASQVSETATQAAKTPVGMLEYAPSGKPARKTKAELAAEDLDAPHAQTPQGVTILGQIRDFF